MSPSVSTQDSLSSSWAGGKPNGKPRFSGVGRRRRRAPYLVIGALLVVICAAGVVVAMMQVGHRVAMLALARPVTVGHVLTEEDLRQVPLPDDTGVGLIPASQQASAVGQPVAYALPAGTLLSRADFGSPQVPPPGQAVVAVAVKPGQFPPVLAAGTTVSVIAVPGNNTGLSQPFAPGGSWTAVVTDVSTPANDQSTVVALVLPTANARQVAAIPSGQLSLMALSPGGQ